MNNLQQLLFLVTSLTLVLFIFCKSALCTWFLFNVFISIYEVYIIYNRNKLTTQECSDDFWDKESNPKTMFKDYWNEYSCKTDDRYFNNKNYVFYMEALNIVFTILLGYAMVYKKKLIKSILILQFINAVVYFSTLKSVDLKDSVYRSISCLWLVIPVILIYKK
jgi:hypothetical protein